MELNKAQELAGQWIEILRPYCERLEIAGSVRRLKPEVKDIEIVTAPRLEETPHLWGIKTINLLLDALDQGVLGGRKIKGGERYQQFSMPADINLDLFMVLPPAQWGILYTIRTGPADFSHWIVTTRRYGGALPSYCKVEDGQLLSGGQPVPMLEEIDFLNFLGLGWIEPCKREAKWRR